MAELVLLLRKPDDEDAYEKALRDTGYEVQSLPVLSFEWLNQGALREALEHPSAYEGIICTSRRSVEALAEVMAWLPSENALWHAKPVYAVGPRTAAELRAIGFEPEGEESGSAEMLAEYIVGRPRSKPLLFLSGDRRRDTLPRRLAAADVPVDEIVVYRTIPDSDMRAFGGVEADWIVVFSPSGLDAVSDDSLARPDVRIAAIGPTTASAIRKQGLRVHAVAEEPSPEALALAIGGSSDR